MKTLVFIGLLGVFAYHCSAIYKDFMGASEKIRTIMGTCGTIGYIAYFVLLIISFWHFTWWLPIITFIASSVIGGLTAIIFQRTLIGVILCPILVLVFLGISIASLLFL